MAWPSWVLGAIRAFRGRAVLVLYLPPPEGESETWRRAQRLKTQPVRAGRRPPRSGALEQASTSPTLHRPSGVLHRRSSNGHKSAQPRRLNRAAVDTDPLVAAATPARQRCPLVQAPPRQHCPSFPDASFAVQINRASDALNAT